MQKRGDSSSQSGVFIPELHTLKVTCAEDGGQEGKMTEITSHK